MSDLKLQLDQALRRGDVAGALRTAAGWQKIEDKPANEVAIEIARTAATVYRDLVADPVHEFAAKALTDLPPDIGPTVNKALARLVKMTEEWEPRLRGCFEERQARELRDNVRSHEFDPACANVTRLCAGRSGDADLERRAEYVGNVLGTLNNHSREADQLIALLARQPEKFNLTHATVSQLKAAKDKRFGQMLGAGLVNLENQWTGTLIGTMTEIKNLLPSKNKMEEPTEAELRDAGDIFRSILRVPVWRRAPELLVDASLLLVDFCPKELSAAGQQSNIEGRTYNTLGFTAKKAVAMSFMEIGRNEGFAKLYTQWAQQPAQAPYAKLSTELMGAFRSPHFAPFLLAAWEAKGMADLRPTLVDAFGNMATAEAIDKLLADLKERLRARSLDPTGMRECSRDLSALGKIARSPRTADAVAKRLAADVIALVPQDNPRLATEAALTVVTGKPEDMAPQHRQWAARTLASALWLADTASDLQRGGEREGILGFRQRMVDALRALGRFELPAILEAMERHALRYGAAYIAAAEALEKIGSPDAIPLLERMLLNAVSIDENKLGAYEKEGYWDAASQSRKSYTKDQVVSVLVFAIGTLGGPESKRILTQLASQVAGQRIEMPGTETARFLQKFVGIVPAGGASPEGAEEAREAVDPAEVKELIKAATGSYFLTGAEKRRMKKIAALARLGQILAEEAIEPVMGELADKDPLVVSAAVGTLAEYAMPNRPKRVRDLLVMEALATLEHKDPARRVGAAKLLREIGPNRPEVREKLLAFLKTADSPEIRNAIGDLLKNGPGAPPPDDSLKEALPPGVSPTAAAKQSALDAKRQYVLARQAWIAGGKKGDPPSPPPG